MEEKNGDIEKEMNKEGEAIEDRFSLDFYKKYANVPPHMLQEGEIHWYMKMNGELVFLSVDREIITDQAKIDRFLNWMWDCQERISKMSNKSVKDLCDIKGLPYRDR
ncbi:hypothetical protein IQ13_0528 [Lacibacter cauensis]|uniref:Uncharacterized protein n=1 Tax=Lacibacter cauensis TaxID=510947 RepID=A0A562SWF9_9BACT|nr:hypothetical protein [Lacibacter cauensis]TWI85368.1 hypothetical protein IQ13_0528 [Lacibacter cauensis]